MWWLAVLAAWTDEPARTPATVLASEVKAVKSVYPDYPVEATAQWWPPQSCAVDVAFSETGSVLSARAAECPAVFATVAEGAVSQWVFDPPRLEGVPQPGNTRVSVRFAWTDAPRSPLRFEAAEADGCAASVAVQAGAVTDVGTSDTETCRLDVPTTLKGPSAAGDCPVAFTVAADGQLGAVDLSACPFGARSLAGVFLKQTRFWIVPGTAWRVTLHFAG